jgi:hypothetical protein
MLSIDQSQNRLGRENIIQIHMYIIHPPSTRETIINSDIGMTKFDLMKNWEPLSRSSTKRMFDVPATGVIVSMIEKFMMGTTLHI